MLGVALAGAMFLGISFLNSPDQLLLFPAAGPDNPDLTITISEAYLNDQLRANLAARGMNLGDLGVKLHAPNRAEVSMTLNLAILNQALLVRPKASFHFAVNGGLVTLVLEQVTISGFNVPQDIMNQQLGSFQRYAQDVLNTEVKRTLTNTGLHLVGVESTENALIIKLAR
jgi:hypothetical protein